jgi:hypothetical protein
MYAWIWRKLPFGLYGKIAGSVLLTMGFGLLLWFVVFPRIESAVVPFDDVQIVDPIAPGPSPSLDEHEIPYETDEPSAPPSPTPSPKPSKKR